MFGAHRLDMRVRCGFKRKFLRSTIAEDWSSVDTSPAHNEGLGIASSHLGRLRYIDDYLRPETGAAISNNDEG